MRSGSSRRRPGSPVSRRQAAEAARAKARQQLEVSAKFAAIGRAAAAETAAALEATRRQHLRQQQQARRAAAVQVETESEHEVDVIITTSPAKGRNKRSSLRSSAEAACAAALAAQATAMRNSTSSSASRVQCIPEAAIEAAAHRSSKGKARTSSSNSLSSGMASISREPASLRALINRQKQHVAAAGKHEKSAAAVNLCSSGRGSTQQRERIASSNAASSKANGAQHVPVDSGVITERQKGSSSRRQPGKAAAEVWVGHSAAAAAGDEASHCSLLAELAATAEQGAAASWGTRQALLAKLLHEWSEVDQWPSCNSEESWELPAHMGEEEQQASTAAVAATGPQQPFGQWAAPRSGSTQPASSLQKMNAGSGKRRPEAAAAAAAAAGGALAPLSQQPEVELAAGSSISSPRALSAAQLVSRAARLEALIHSCSSSTGAAAARAKRSLLPWLDEQPQAQHCDPQQLAAAGSGPSTAQASISSSCSSAAGYECAGSYKKSATAARMLPALTDSLPVPEEAAAAAAAAVVSAASLSCRSSLQADLAVAFDEDARLHSLLASSSSSSSSSSSIASDSRRNSTEQQACSNEPADVAQSQGVGQDEGPGFALDESAAATGGGNSLHTGDGDWVAGLAGYEQQAPDEAAQQQPELPLSEAAVQLMLQEASPAQPAPFDPAADDAMFNMSELAAAVLLHEESSTASLAEFEQEIAAMLIQSGAAGGTLAL
uniref:Uncharacterized protein n=1 Tax=Tetradesmus obliquus TaxID=3088 RepID=A0A383VX00_TETOB|eukprot:jgi/Sobl393_1/14417/SZX69379.1